MKYPSEFKYTKEHEWVKLDGDVATIGITAFALEQLGDVVHLELPKVGTTLVSGKGFGTIESTKTVSDLYSPVNGTITEINAQALQSPESLAQDPHNAYWLCKAKFTSLGDGLISSEQYEKYVLEESNH
jgi:glycine cleavage system H protein